jgi:hypothetical protein
LISRIRNSKYYGPMVGRDEAPDQPTGNDTKRPEGPAT